MQCQTKGEPPCVLYFTVLSILLWLFHAGECQDQRSSLSNQGSSLFQQAVPGASVTSGWSNQERHSLSGSVEPTTPPPPRLLPSITSQFTSDPSDYPLSSPLGGHMHDGYSQSTSPETTVDSRRHNNTTPKGGREASGLTRIVNTVSPTFSSHGDTDQDVTPVSGTPSLTSKETFPTIHPGVSGEHQEYNNLSSLSPSTPVLPSSTLIQQASSHVSHPHPSATATPSLHHPPTTVQIAPSKTFSSPDVNSTSPADVLSNSSSHYRGELVGRGSNSSSLPVTMDYSSVPLLPTVSQPLNTASGAESPTNTLDSDPQLRPVNGSADDRQGLGYSEATPSGEPWNQTSVLPPGEEGLSVGGIVGITLACALLMVAAITIGIALYHRNKSRQLDTTKAQSNHYTGLWDDSVTLSYINNHFDFFQKDVQDEMVSLDNDAYLNSLEFMVFTNTWGDGKRNTRF